MSASLALIFSPGPASMHVLTSSVKGGYQGGVAATCGTCSGLLVHTTAAILGLSAILRTSAVAYTVVKAVGAIYLIYLGIQILRNQDEMNLQVANTDVNVVDNYKQGLVINVLNPKVAVFFLAFLPQFVPDGSHSGMQLLILGILYTTLAFLYQTLLVGLSSKIRALLKSRPTITERIRQTAGTVFVLFGLELALSEHTPT